MTSLFVLSSCTQQKVEKLFVTYESEFNIELPNNYDVLFYKSSTSIDSLSTYIVLELNEDYALNYDEQFTSDYARYDDFNVLSKIALAKNIFKNLIRAKDEKYFITTLVVFDWYAYEYTSVTGRYNVVRYVDLYVIIDQETNTLYVFYDEHQYPYNDQARLA